MNNINNIVQILIDNSSFVEYFKKIKNKYCSYDTKHKNISNSIFKHDNIWLPVESRISNIEEAKIVSHKIFKYFSTYPKENTFDAFDAKVKQAMDKALTKKSSSRLSLFNSYVFRANLHENNITMSNSMLSIRSVEALHADYDENINIDFLCKKLNDESTFKKRFINVPLSPVNEYHLQTFCQEHGIYYPSNIDWKPIIFRILKIHVSTMYQIDYANYLLNKSKQEIKTMPTNSVNTTSDLYNSLNEQIEVLTFNRPVTVGIVHTVNDKDVKTMSKQDLFNCTVTLKNSMKALSPMKKESKAVRKEIKHQKKILKVVIKYLDNK